MKIQLLILSILVLFMKCDQTDQKQKNIDSSFLQNELNDYGSLKLWVNNYIEPAEQLHIDDKLKQFSWQYNINYIDESFKQSDYEVIYLRRFVDRFIRTIPIPQWPMVVRYMVFPQIYGYYSNEVLRNYLLKLYKFEAHYHPFITGDSFSFGAANDMFSAISAEDVEKLKQLEKLSRLEQLKREVDQNLLSQTQQLLEAQDYEKKIEELVEKVNLLAEKMKLENGGQDAHQIASIQEILNSIIDKRKI